MPKKKYKASKKKKNKKPILPKIDKLGFKKGERLLLWKATQQALSNALIGRGYSVGNRFNKYASILYKEVLENKSQFYGKKNYINLLKFAKRNAYQIVTQTQENRKWALYDDNIVKDLLFYEFQDEIEKDEIYENYQIIFQSYSDEYCDIDSFEGNNNEVSEWFNDNVKPFCRKEYGNSYARVVYSDSGINEDGSKWIEYKFDTTLVENENANEIVKSIKADRSIESDKPQSSESKNETQSTANIELEREKEKTKQLQIELEREKEKTKQSKEETRRKALDAYLSGKISETAFNLLIS